MNTLMTKPLWVIALVTGLAGAHAQASVTAAFDAANQSAEFAVGNGPSFDEDATQLYDALVVAPTVENGVSTKSIASSDGSFSVSCSKTTQLPNRTTCLIRVIESTNLAEVDSGEIFGFASYTPGAHESQGLRAHFSGRPTARFTYEAGNPSTVLSIDAKPSKFTFVYYAFD